jgi:hypothetical protein
MESAEQPPRLSGLQNHVQSWQVVRLLERLRRWSEHSEQGGDAVSPTSGNGASHNGADDNGDVDSPEDIELDAIVAGAAQTAVERAAAEKAKDPLGENNSSIFPTLLIGAQVSYNTDTWSPDLRSRAPEGSPERLAYESDPITFSHPEVKAAFRFVDKLDTRVDAELGLTDED